MNNDFDWLRQQFSALFSTVSIECFRQKFARNKTTGFSMHWTASTLQLAAHFSHTLAASCVVHEEICAMKTGLKLAKLWNTRLLFQISSSIAECPARELHLEHTRFLNRSACLTANHGSVMMLCGPQLNSILLGKSAHYSVMQLSVTTL